MGILSSQLSTRRICSTSHMMSILHSLFIYKFVRNILCFTAPCSFARSYSLVAQIDCTPHLLLLRVAFESANCAFRSILCTLATFLFTLGFIILVIIYKGLLQQCFYEICILLLSLYHFLVYCFYLFVVCRDVFFTNLYRA